MPSTIVPATADQILARPAYMGGMLLNQGLNWKDRDKERLRILCEACADVERSAAALGREPKTLAYKARELGVVMPESWTLLLPKPKYVPHPRERVQLLRYPFIIKATGDQADLIAVTNLVPKGLPDEMRADICQEILLAVYQGKINISTLEKRPDLVRNYVKQWRRDNVERGGYGVMSLSQYCDDDRANDEIASSIAAKDWDWQQMNDKRSAHEAMMATFTQPTQIDDVYRNEMRRHHKQSHAAGRHLSFAETVEIYG
ncbi:hypothetical protein [Zavarzinella formosa]|uniref:hypothetical protein n=1 Tax=Zavarzinella formosa TaxID=360055 RepID=UPI0012F81491|nr:hypothetical protein [Zavarzinella formosa]